MRSFDDFDAWGDAVSGASLRLVCDAVEQYAWTLGVVQLGDVVLQVAAEGGGNLCYGANTHDGPTVFVPLTLATEQVVNAEPLDEDSLFFIPRGADFRIRVRRHAHAWCSIALPPTALAQAAAMNVSGRISCPPGAVPRLRRRVVDIANALADRSGTSEAHRVAGCDLLETLDDCLPGPIRGRVATGRPRLDRAAIIRRAMDAIESALAVPTASDLATLVGVTDRTLLRAFRESYGVPPKRYLMLRELHRIRRSLLAGAAEDATVADLLARHGIWEFGRFAARYRTQFGELPSETLRRSRA